MVQQAGRQPEAAEGVFMKRFISAIAGSALLAAAAYAQSDWTQIAHDSGVGVTFYYSPGSVGHDGGYATAKWHDSNHPELVFLAQVDCSARTIQSLSVDRYDPQSGAFIGTVDLRNNGSPQQIGPMGTMAANLAQAIC
jgi:hypothetical protein